MKPLVVRKLEKTKLKDGKYAFLVSRNYRQLKYLEYLVCINYNFKNNTYSEAASFDSTRLSDAYDYYNLLVLYGSFDFAKRSKERNFVEGKA